MKRLNPTTNLPFKQGDIREDGYVFYKYATHKPIKKNGCFQELWLNPNSLECQKERCRKVNKKHYYADPLTKNEKSRKWREQNPEKRYNVVRAWTLKNRHKMTAYGGKRRAAKLLRTPKWLTQADIQTIEQMYHLAKICTEIFGIPWHVDHIYPLQGKKVSGLHVPANLQVIPAKLNLKKSNKHEI